MGGDGVMRLENKKEIINVLKIDMKVRLVIVAVGYLMVFVMMALGVSISPVRLGVFIGLILAFYVIFRLIIIFNRVHISVKYIFNVFDVLLVTYALDGTGGFNSPFFMIYFLIPLTEGFTHTNRRMLLFSWCIPVVVYPVYIIAWHRCDFTGEDISVLVSRVVFILVVGLISDYYQKIMSDEKEKVKKANEEIKKMNQSLEMIVEIRTQELKNAQEQLIQSAKMAVVGQLASGTAHELNNPLTVILGHAQLLLKQEQKDREIRESLLEIEEHTKRCKEIIQNLLGFSRKYRMKDEKLNIDDVINNAIVISGHQLKIKNVEIIKEFGKNVPPIKGNRDLLEQVFFNLFMNAQQAMPKGGNITVYTELDKDNTVRIEVLDKGKGISKDDLPKVFDPFFTTKNIGEGTGLGLFVTYSIIEKSEGRIRVESKGKGRGAKFIINLPRYQEDKKE